jgi:hypothetical protein
MTDRWGPPVARTALVAEGASTRSLGERGPGADRARIGMLALPRPIVYRALPEDVPPPFGRGATDGKRQVVGLFCPVELGELPRGQSYGSVEVEVALPTGCRAVAFPDAPADVTGRYAERFLQTFRPPTDGRLERALVAHALVEAPADAVVLSGEVSVRAVVHRSVARFVQSVSATSERSLAFAEGIPDRPTVGAGRAVRLVVSVDVRGYGTRGIEDGERTQNRLASVLDRAREATETAVDDRQEGGDSLMLVFPPGIDEITVLRRFHAALVSGLAEVNLELNEQAAMRVRLGVDRGLTVRAGLGWAGQAPVVAGRLRDAPQARTATATAHVVMTVSDPVHRDVFREPGAVPAGDAFQQIDVEIPEKAFSARAWLHTDY